MGDWRQQLSTENADQAAQTFRFFLIYPFVGGAVFTLVAFVASILNTTILDLTEGRTVQIDLVRGAQGMIPVYLIIVAAIFVGEIAYIICKRVT